ncbi:hypothetical protein QQ045_026897 [Rhodiola kirilowii]
MRNSFELKLLSPSCFLPKPLDLRSDVHHPRPRCLATCSGVPPGLLLPAISRLHLRPVGGWASGWIRRRCPATVMPVGGCWAAGVDSRGVWWMWMMLIRRGGAWSSCSLFFLRLDISGLCRCSFGASCSWVLSAASFWAGCHRSGLEVALEGFLLSGTSLVAANGLWF